MHCTKWTFPLNPIIQKKLIWVLVQYTTEPHNVKKLWATLLCQQIQLLHNYHPPAPAYLRIMLIFLRIYSKTPPLSVPSMTGPQPQAATGCRETRKWKAGGYCLMEKMEMSERSKKFFQGRWMCAHSGGAERAAAAGEPLSAQLHRDLAPT